MSTPTTPPPPPLPYPQKNSSVLRGCLLGCLVIFVGIGVLAVLAFAALYTIVSGAMEDFTTETPREIPSVSISEEQKEQLFGKVDMFANALEGKDAPLETLELTAEEINVLLREYPNPNSDFQWVHVEIVDDALRGEISMPLDEFNLPGRFLNGSGELLVTMMDGQLEVVLNSLEVDGKSLPIQLLSMLRDFNLARDVNNDTSVRRSLERIDSIVVRDGKLVITPKPQ